MFMVKAIIYQSHTGFSRQFAYHFAIKVGVPVYSLKEAQKLKDNMPVIYFSWIKNGKIVDLKKASRFNISYVCAVGALYYSEEIVKKLKEENNIDKLYYLQGGIRYYKLNMFERHFMNSLKKSIIKKQKTTKLSDIEKELLIKLEKGYEEIDLESLNALIEWCINENTNIVS